MRLRTTLFVAAVALSSLAAARTLAARAPDVTRLPGNPIIRPAMLPGTDGGNINGPSLVRVPAWAQGALGRYYLYFADHAGTYIRLAYADQLTGPWTIHRPGVFRLADAPGCRGHIASPDVLIEEQARQVRLYFHCPTRHARGQKTFLAVSPDGLRFTAGSEVLGRPYLRVFRHEGWWYAMAEGGTLARSADGLRRFEQGPNPFGAAASREGGGPRPRHVAVLPETGALAVYFSNIGDAPERIRMTRIPTGQDWRTWRTGAVVEVLRPELPWEGAALPVRASAPGKARGPENALRDPAVFVDTDGRRYLLYTVAGESGIAIAEIR